MLGLAAELLFFFCRNWRKTNHIEIWPLNMPKWINLETL